MRRPTVPAEKPSPLSLSINVLLIVLLRSWPMLCLPSRPLLFPPPLLRLPPYCSLSPLSLRNQETNHNQAAQQGINDIFSPFPLITVQPPRERIPARYEVVQLTRGVVPQHLVFSPSLPPSPPLPLSLLACLRILFSDVSLPGGSPILLC
eukprot:scaffold185230_cov30-Tisochrysis_lutea.AAC.1